MRVDARTAHRGFVFIDAIVGVAVFATIMVGIYTGYQQLNKAIRLSRLQITAAALVNEQFEIVRNLPFSQVGVVSGIPSGVIPYTQTITRDNVPFVITATIRDIDDPFDGTFGGSPNDTSPADMKLVQFDIECPSCIQFTPQSFVAHIAPKNLETTTNNGALFVRVFDALGNPIQDADVLITNTTVVPNITINDVTNASGMLQIVNTPPSVQSYSIQISKSGYSSDGTLPVGAPSNPQPTKPHATVAVQQLTQASFSIDRVSSLSVSTKNTTCSGIPSVAFSLTGSKNIGTSPVVKKYSQSFTTDGAGARAISNLEWDTYTLSLTDPTYALAGTISSLPIVLSPNTTQDVKLVVATNTPNSLLVTVKDASTQLPVSGAEVTISRPGFSSTSTTGRGFITQTDWSGGSGQSTFSNQTMYASGSYVETGSTPGSITLATLGSVYVSDGSLISSTFDTGSTANFHQLFWEPASQPAQTGSESVRFQVASNNDTTTWNFVGPDGTASTYYTTPGTNISTVHNGHRYFRYKVYLSTSNTAYTPSVSDVSFTFTTECIPPGQVFFSGLTNASHDISVTKTGYQDHDDSVTTSTSWREHTVTLSP